MTDFMIRFFLCNVLISGITGILLAAKQIFRNLLSSRMQYNLWFLFLGLLAVPFLPVHPIGFSQILSLLGNTGYFPAAHTESAIGEDVVANLRENANWMNDFTLSVNSRTASVAGQVLLVIWLLGIFVMLILALKSSLRLRAIKQSSLPLQNPEVYRLYQCCLEEMRITRDIPVYSTAFLKSPVIVGLLNPCIYLPIHLISDYQESDMRYMLLHELQHYRHKDAIPGFIMNLAAIFYWFNPFVWFALKEMRNDREVACDTSVLEMLEEEDYEDYGNTLINFAEKVSLSPFPFATSLGGNMRQMKKRIANIASYERPSFGKRVKGMAVFMATVLFLSGFAPFISTYAAETSHYQWESVSGNISGGGTLTFLDLSACFGEYEGSFVLYDLGKDAWSIHNMEQATLRVSPDSTYKIYDALFGLEEGVITPENSLIPWNGETYPFEPWNADQTLDSAMDSSVNWYFQAIDEELGFTSVNSYIKKIGYGNENINGDFSSYWLESSLKISPVEQVELLTKLYRNEFGFAPENIHALKDSICLSASDTGAFYGKTGTGRVDGQDVNGWFVGFVETSNNTYFFATNIGADSDATGSTASKITMRILSDMNIWGKRNQYFLFP